MKDPGISSEDGRGLGMKRHIPVKLPAICGLLCALAPSAAWSAEQACPGAYVVGDDALRDRWPDFVAQVRREVLSRDDIDACARIRLRLAEDTTIGVEVALPDGRAASRVAVRAEDVLPILQALLLVPEHALAVATPTHPPKTDSKNDPLRVRPPAAHVTTVDRAEGVNTSGLPAAKGAKGVGVELSVVGGARFGDGQASYGLGAHSLLDIRGWLFGFEGRMDRYYEFSGAQMQTALELGVLAGKRVRFGATTLDVLAGPGFAIKGELASETEVAVSESPAQPMPPPQPPPPDPSSGPVPRLLTAVHLGFSPHSVLRSFVGVDGTFGPARADGLGPNSPSMPRWTLGLTLGATVGTP